MGKRWWRGRRPTSIDEVRTVLAAYGTADRPTLSKFHNEPTDGYASKKEAQRAHELKLMLQAGLITDLREQVRYELIESQEGEGPCHYIADFVYRICKTGEEIVEDVKGYETPVFKIKRKLMLKIYGIRVKTV